MDEQDKEHKRQIDEYFAKQAKVKEKNGEYVDKDIFERSCIAREHLKRYNSKLHQMRGICTKAVKFKSVEGYKMSMKKKYETFVESTRTIVDED